MDFTDVRVWAALVIVVQFVIAGLNWIGRKSFVMTENLLAVHKVLQDQLDEQQRQNMRAHHRIEMLEERLKGLPTYEVTNDLATKLSSLAVSVSAMASEIRGIDGRTEQIDSAVIRIEQLLMSESKSKSRT